VGLVLVACAVTTCVALPLMVPDLEPARTQLWACGGALLLAAGVLFYAHGQIVRQLASVHDEGQRSAAEKQTMAEQLRRQRDFTETVLDTAGALVIVFDRTGRIVRFNDACERLTGYREHDMFGQYLWEVLEPADGRTMRAAMETIDAGKVRVRADASRRIEVTWRDQTGERHRIAFTVTVLLNRLGEIEYFVATGQDVTEQRRNHEHLIQLATLDQLTGLVNRSTFQNALGYALNGQDARGAALLFCDLDGFKGVNDTMGHAAGDELLVAVGKRLRRVVRQHDVVARLGGDEFVVLCPGLDEIAAHRLADRIRKAIAAPYGVSGGEARIGVSVGVAVAPAGSNPEKVLSEADSEMYRAKQRTKAAAQRWAAPAAADRLAPGRPSPS
jgi:diguanylate cyclase (GGDEF)-like protein/PAS domain S-box-containing protein